MVEIDKIEFHDNLPSLFNHTRPRTAGRAARKGKGTAPEAGAHPKGRNEMEEPREARLAHRPSGPTAARRLPRCPWPAQWQRRRAVSAASPLENKRALGEADRKSVGEGKGVSVRVDPGGRRSNNKNKIKTQKK